MVDVKKVKLDDTEVKLTKESSLKESKKTKTPTSKKKTQTKTKTTKTKATSKKVVEKVEKEVKPTLGHKREQKEAKEQLVLKDIVKVYGKDENKVTAIKGMSFTINEGEFVVILGASGAGKSTLLNILGGMDTASSGQFLINGKDVTKYNDKELGIYRRKEIGFVFQFYNLMPNLTALENVILAESLSDNPLDSKEILNLVGLGHRENNFPSGLSGGEQQRVAIARAIVKNPTLLLCDEPTGALDSKTGAKILKLLRDVNQKYNKTIIIVTHNAAISEMADRVVTLQDGLIVEDNYNEIIKDVDEIVW